MMGTKDLLLWHESEFLIFITGFHWLIGDSD
jgi:hypothetical protein